MRPSWRWSPYSPCKACTSTTGTDINKALDVCTVLPRVRLPAEQRPYPPSRPEALTNWTDRPGDKPRPRARKGQEGKAARRGAGSGAGGRAGEGGDGNGRRLTNTSLHYRCCAVCCFLPDLAWAVNKARRLAATPAAATARNRGTEFYRPQKQGPAAGGHSGPPAAVCLLVGAGRRQTRQRAGRGGLPGRGVWLKLDRIPTGSSPRPPECLVARRAVSEVCLGRQPGVRQRPPQFRERLA